MGTVYGTVHVSFNSDVEYFVRLHQYCLQYVCVCVCAVTVGTVREIIAVCSEIHTKHINTLCGQNVELVNVKLAVHIVTTGL